MPTFEIVGVAEARSLGRTRVWLRFSDGVAGSIDLADEVTSPRFPQLNDPERFAQLTVAAGGLAWPSGFDCAPEWLYEKVIAANRPGVRSNDEVWATLHRQLRGMPEISRFFGIVIRMFYSDRSRPHFHAEYGEYVISVEIDGDGVHGRFPPARLPMLFEWRDQHRPELLENWERLRRGQPPVDVEPLG